MRARLGRFPDQARSAQCWAMSAGTLTKGSAVRPGARARSVVGHVLVDRPGQTALSTCFLTLRMAVLDMLDQARPEKKNAGALRPNKLEHKRL